MSHPGSISEKIGDVHIKAKSFRTNLYLYKSIGGAVEVRGEKKKRSWKCLWLCKKRVKVKADRIVITNQYYSRIDDTPVLVSVASSEKTCANASDCTSKHYAYGVGVKIEFPNGGASPSGLDDLLPLQGVLSTASVTIDGRTHTFVTASGPHPA